MTQVRGAHRLTFTASGVGMVVGVQVAALCVYMTKGDLRSNGNV
jgi:hypothetical protein